MDLPEIRAKKDIAIDLVASVLNKAQEMIGIRQDLSAIANTRAELAGKPILPLNNLNPPLAITSEKFITDAIEKTWKLTNVFKYHLRYLGASNDECSQYYYFEVLFSQPTAAYPIPQTTCSVFFRVEQKLTEPPKEKGVPLMMFRVEGQHSEHDVRYVRLIPDWILAVMVMKMRLFRRIEHIRMF